MRIFFSFARGASIGRRNRARPVVQAPNGATPTGSLAWSSVPASIQLTAGSTVSLASYVSNPGGHALTWTIESGTLPTGVTFENGVFTAAADATLGESGDIVVGVDDGQEEPPGSGELATTFTLTSASSGTKPFTIGMGFKEGDATNVVTDLASYQVDVKRRWLDGSVKHAVISGRAALTAGTPLTVNVTAGTPPAGTPLAAADIAAAAPTASVQCGTLGTVSLADLLASPFRTWISGPEMVECHYRADVGGGTLLAVWFHVRLYADGRLRVRAIVENGYLDNGAGAVAANADQTYDATVTIGGVQAFSQAGLVHYKNTGWMAEGWIGGDPAVTALHDVAYLTSTKLVPNYGIGGQPSSGTLDAQVQAYTPMSNGSWTGAMGNTGYQAQIGLLPNWDALYCKSGDVRALRSVEVNAHHLRSYPIVWRSSATKLPATPTSFPTWTVYGPGQGGVGQLGAGSISWEPNHHGSGGYLAYLLTGDYAHYETMSLQTALVYLAISSARGSGVNRNVRTSAPRGVAWALRTLAQFCALAPDGDTPAADYRDLLASQWTYWASQGPENVDASPLGYPAAMGTYDPAEPLTCAPWMYHFWIAANGHAWDIEPGHADSSKHQAIRDWMYRAVVGILGGNGVDNYCYSKASIYSFQISDTVVANFAYSTPDIFYDTWGEVFAASFGADNTACGTALEGTSAGAPSSAAGGYWGNLLPAIAYAVDHGATDADAAWTRLTGATNWSDVENSGFGNQPVWGIVPRVA